MQIFITANGQILKNNLSIWSHCSASLARANEPYLQEIEKILKESNKSTEEIVFQENITNSPEISKLNLIS